MEHEKVIFFRNFFFRAFIIGVAFALLLFYRDLCFLGHGGILGGAFL